MPDELPGPDATDSLIFDFATLSDEELLVRVWLAASMIAAHSGVLTPNLVLQVEAGEALAADWDTLKADLRRASTPQHLRNR